MSNVLTTQGSRKRFESEDQPTVFIRETRRFNEATRYVVGVYGSNSVEQPDGTHRSFFQVKDHVGDVWVAEKQGADYVAVV